MLALVLLAIGVEWWWVAFVIGGGLIPLMYGLASWYGEREQDAGDGTARSEQQDALEALRSRYARGELSETEFERRLERLVETETVEDARRSVEQRQGRERPADEREPVEQRDLERERE